MNHRRSAVNHRRSAMFGGKRARWRLGLATGVALAICLGHGEPVASGTADNPLAAVAPGQDVTDALSGVDFVPSKSTLDGLLNDPASDLRDIATEETMDSGLRIRAIRALSNYPSAATTTTLDELLTTLAPFTEGTNTLLLRATMYSLATTGGVDAATTLTPLLEHESRDVRADAAHTLALSGSPVAIQPLRARLNGLPGETEPQVRWALAEAIRSLSE